MSLSSTGELHDLSQRGGKARRLCERLLFIAPVALLVILTAHGAVARPTSVRGVEPLLHDHIPPAGREYYIDSANGSDSSPGTLARPWRTIQHAANTMVAGDVCHVLPGHYAERVQVAISGAAGAPIAYRAVGTVTMMGFAVRADYVTIAGFEITATDDDWYDGVGIFVEGSHCTIEDNYVHHSTRGGIEVFARTGEETLRTGCTVRNNRLYRNSQVGIEINGTNHVVEGNEIWGTIQYHPNWTNPPSWVDADGIRFFGSGHIFRGNYIHDITFADPENVDPHIDCFQTWGPAYDIVFDRNHCENLEYQAKHEYGNAFMIEEQIAPVHTLTITNNIVRSVGFLNVRACEGLFVAHNTYVGNLSLPPQTSIVLSDSPSATIKNNVFYEVGNTYLSFEAASLPGIDAGYNVVDRSDGRDVHGTSSSRGLWNIDPQLLNPAAGDFRLQFTSPCIDAGANLSIPWDYAGHPRPRGAGYDIGAYESQVGLLYLPPLLR